MIGLGLSICDKSKLPFVYIHARATISNMQQTLCYARSNSIRRVASCRSVTSQAERFNLLSFVYWLWQVLPGKTFPKNVPIKSDFLTWKGPRKREASRPAYNLMEMELGGNFFNLKFCHFSGMTFAVSHKIR